MSTVKRLIFDIETVGEEFEKLDSATKESLTRWIERESGDDADYERALADLKDGLGFSPLTGEIVAIGTLDPDSAEGAVYFQSPGKKSEGGKEGGIALKPQTEKQMLESFWKLAERAEVFVSFNGRSFDAPFLMIRSAIHGVRPSKDLMRARYLYQQSPNAVHIDLLDQLGFYGAMRRKGSLHLWCRAFGIKSPKSDGITGDDVGKLFKEKKYMEIARYNVGDLLATAELFKKWQDYLRF